MGDWRRSERGRVESGFQVVHKPEHTEECAKVFVCRVGLAKLDGKLLDAQSSGLQVAGELLSLVRSVLELDELGARSSRLGIQAIRGLNRRSKPVLDLGQAVLEVGPR